MSTRALIRWMICAWLLGFAASDIMRGVIVKAQANMITLYGCTSITNCTGSANIPVLVDSTGLPSIVGQ